MCCLMHCCQLPVQQYMLLLLVRELCWLHQQNTDAAIDHFSLGFKASSCSMHGMQCTTMTYNQYTLAYSSITKAAWSVPHDASICHRDNTYANSNAHKQITMDTNMLYIIEQNALQQLPVIQYACTHRLQAGDVHCCMGLHIQPPQQALLSQHTGSPGSQPAISSSVAVMRSCKSSKLSPPPGIRVLLLSLCSAAQASGC